MSSWTPPVSFCHNCCAQPSTHKSKECSTNNSEGYSNVVLDELAKLSSLPQCPFLHVTRFKTVANGGCTHPKIGMIINLHEQDHSDETKTKWMSEIKYVWNPIRDDKSQEFIYSCAIPMWQIIEEFHRNDPDKWVVVNCQAGVSRSVSLCLFYALITGASKTYEEALVALAKERPLACPNLGFATQIQSCFAAANRHPIPIYVAGKFSEAQFIRKYVMDPLERIGFTITHDWTRFEMRKDVTHSEMAEKDINGVLQSTLSLFLFTDANYPYRGTSCKLGAALAQNKEIVAFTPPLPSPLKYSENVFFHHPLIRHIYGPWSQLWIELVKRSLL